MEKKLKVLLYSPYVPKHTGGGEKYFFDVALTLAKKHTVVIGIPNLNPRDTQAIKKKYEDFLGYRLDGLELRSCLLGSSASFLSKLFFTQKFDVVYYITDGSLFFSLARRNILHIQVPLQLSKVSLIERLKLAQWQVKNTNSFFTKSVIEESWNTKINVVHQPMISMDELSLTPTQLVRKEKIILSVGRFFSHLHSKRQDILVQLFQQLQKQSSIAREWQLVLIGAVEDEEFAQKVSELAQGLPIHILHDVSRTELLSWYKKASIYWHAAGFEVDQTLHPEKVEHFGISTLEAMAACCAPIVINKGGQPEILSQELGGYLWDFPDQCIDLTESLMADPELRQEVQQQANKRARDFDGTRFTQQLFDMVEGKI